MKKILIIGSKGMAGHMLYHYFKENTAFEVIDIARGTEFHTPSYQLNVTDFASLEATFKKEKPNYVVNCIGVLNRNAEEHPDNAVLLNSYFPHFLAAKGTELGFKLIHISTDCVFNGQKGGYTETSVKDGFGFYAQSKALGEVSYGDHLTLRTSIIGPDLNKNGIGLFHWFMSQKGVIKGYSDAYWTGVTTLELAKAIIEAINQDLTGLHHLVNDKKINKYELTNLFRLTFDKDDVEIVAYEGYKVDKSLVRTNFDFDYSVKPYVEMIEEMKEWIVKHADLYTY